MNKKQVQEITIHVPLQENKLLGMCTKAVNENKEIYALWKIINVNAIDRLGMSDHGVVHFQIVANIALRLSRILKKHKVLMSIEKDFQLSDDHAEVVIFLASILHDLGMSINREGHEEFSLFLANAILKDILNFLPTYERTIVISETLHAIISHRKGGKPNTIEAGIVRVSDALDMGEGRSRIPYESGNIGIYSISDTAINSVSIKEGTEKPIMINIEMNNSAGIFQVDELLKGKIKGSGIEKYIEVTAHIKDRVEKKLIKEIVIKLQ
jgi:hypothetical protein